MKTNIFVWFLLLFNTNVALAQESTSLKDLRTLFTTTQIRQQLNEQRNQGKFDSTKNSTTNTKLREPIKVNMQGMVIRKNKKTVIFINNENTLKSTIINNEIKVRAGYIKNRSLKIPIRVKQQTIKLKPGQQWNETTHIIEENYRIKHTKAKTNDNDNDDIDDDN